MFDFAEATKEMSAAEILNYYRNLYYAEPQVTERGIVANAINDYLTAGVQEVKHGKWDEIRDGYGKLEGWIHRECGRMSMGKDKYCPKCGARMNLED